jgi:hypothetical protein
VSQALTYTGQTLTEPELALASGMITTYSGVTEDQPADSISARDRVWLAMASAYQAVWMKGKPGVLTQRESHTVSSSDGVSVTREADAQVMLAPMASRCLRNLSWLGTRSVRHVPDHLARYPFTDERADSLHAWTSRPIA